MNDLKERFFAYYWGQCVGSRLYKAPVFCLGDMSSGFVDTRRTTVMYLMDGIPCVDYLGLKNLKDISDEDLNEMVEFYNKVRDSAFRLDKTISKKLMISRIHCQETVDYLRSKGYLVPYMDLSCEEIIEKGWAKYK